MLKIAIVIVHYRTPELLRDCLRSIEASEGPFEVQLCVVDNASGDESVAMVRDEFPAVAVIEQRRNEGYAFANNLGMRHFGLGGGGEVEASEQPDYLLLLNPDTLLPPGALAAMVQFMEEHPEAGAAGPRLIRGDGTLDKACRRSFPTPEVSLWRLTGLSSLFPKHPRFGRYNLTYIDDNETVEVDSVVGAFMLMRREAILAAGPLDTTFFMYGEDLDLAYRIKEAGWKIWYHGAVTVLHYKGSASKQRSTQSIFHFYDAMRIFHEKHYAMTLPRPLNWLITLAIWSLCALNLARNTFRPPQRRGVASAV